MTAIGDNLKAKIDKIKASEWLKNKKVIGSLVIGSAIVILSVGITLTKDNAYQITINNEIVGVVEDKAQIVTVLDAVITEKEQQSKSDLVINEKVLVEPVYSKKNEFMNNEDLSKKIASKLSYQTKAITLTINGVDQVTVSTKEEADAILKQVAAGQLPEGAEVELIFKPTIPQDMEVESKAAEGTEAASGVEGAEAASGVEGAEAASGVEGTEAASGVEGAEAASGVEGAEAASGAEGTEAASGAEGTEAAKGAEGAEAASGAEGTETAKEAEGTEAAENEQGLEEIVSEKGKKEALASKRVHINKVTVNGQDHELESTESVKREIKDFDFYQRVVMQEVYVNTDEMISQEEAVNILLSNTDEVVYYEMEEGDNVWDLAIKYGTTMDRILAINPQIVDVSRMQIGERIKIEAPDPILAMVTTQQATFKELIPSEIEYVEFSDLYKDQTKVYQEGHDGLKEISVIVHKINGKEVARELVSEKPIKEPKTKVIAYGTKPRPKAAPSASGAGKAVNGATSGMFMHPLNGKGRISSNYGGRGGGFHRGIDIAASAGTPVYASASGTITYSGYNKGGFGKLIIIDHGNGYETYYAHNSKLYVNVGQYVNKGQNIAAVGSTGNSTGNHVHFEIRRNGSPINPYGYIY